MVYQVLATAVDWQHQVPETGTLTVITDSIKADATFLLLHTLASSLKQTTNEETVILVSFEQIFVHYSRILRKMGSNVDALKLDGRLAFVDGLSELSELTKLKKNHLDTSTNVSDAMKPNSFIKGLGDLNAADTVSALMQAVLGCSYKIDNTTNNKPARKIKGIFIHGLSVLVDIACGANIIRLFINILKTYLQENGGFLVILTNADQDIINESEAEDDFVSLLTGILYQADLVFQVEPLISGYSTDVTGQISIASKPHYKAQISGPTVLHYKTQDTKTVFFAPGQMARF
ncbi:hypothetical protein BB561_000574 [Smittium simulii]|uniref:Elongator complex protein 6 n=1 Tax=Smittium simulii TaxID=133385 RepID=A0A2T9YYH7_9FUNG|nr:hypothetical protein BB561_000574 [Smittium simulii]